MGFKCGIVGLPNVGKSTLFNALLGTIAAQAANYPFCTIEPNSGVVAVPDERLGVLASIAKSREIIPTKLEFVDIAGLVAGASKGEGLGNQFLGNIREVDAIIHVVRCFDDGEIVHVAGSVDPMRDIDIINTELMLADMESLSKRIGGLEKKAKGGDKESVLTLEVIRPVLAALEAGKPALFLSFEDEKAKAFRSLQLLSAKPVLFVCNVEESAAATGNEYSSRVAGGIAICAKIEQDIAQMPAADQGEFLGAMGLAETGLSKIIRAAYGLLDLITFFAAGEKETHAWTLRRGLKAPKAAGEIHSDFERGFIRAETISYADFAACGGEAKAREAGKLRTEGKDYVVQDGDIFHFLFN